MAGQGPRTRVHHDAEPATSTGSNPEFRLCVALDEDGKPGGFLRIVPVYGDAPGYTLDLMRRDPDTPNGMTEFLLTRTLMQLDELGYSSGSR